MNALEINAVEKLANEFRNMKWERFVDAADIRLDHDKNHLVFQDIKAAWELSHPISIYVTDAMEMLGFSSGSDQPQSEQK